MPEITTSSIDDLLSQAEERLQSHPPDSKLNAVPAVKLSHDVSMPKVKEEKLSVRQPQIAMTGAAKKNVGCHAISLFVFLLTVARSLSPRLFLLFLSHLSLLVLNRLECW